MMKLRTGLCAPVALGLVMGLTYAAAQTPAAAPPPGLPFAFRAYLADSGVHRDGLAPLAVVGSIRDNYDRSVFKATRTLEGSPRWVLAQADGGRGILKAFSCAAGTGLTNDNVPALSALLSRYRTDMIAITRASAGPVAPRPFDRDKGPTCLADKALTMASGTPTIQSAWGWTVGMILAEALPARTDALMNRARAYGESAAICGFSSASDVSAGRDVAAALFARMRADPEFAADLARAKAEVAAVASRSPAPEGCPAEAALIATPAY